MQTAFQFITILIEGSIISSVFKFLEKNFFNILTKKITGNLSFILVLQIFILAITYYYHGKLTKVISMISDNEIKQNINNILTSVFNFILLTTLFIMFTIIVMIFVLRFLIVRPIKEIVETLNEVGRGDGDMSKTLSANTHDEMRELSESYNPFIDKLRNMIREVRLLGVHIGVDSAKTMNNFK